MKGVFIETEKCIGCRHCEVACAIEHSSEKQLIPMFFEVPQTQPRISVKLGVDMLTFPNKCQHCDPAPCEEACPVGAIYRDEDIGAVLIHEDRCISCGMCAMVCPFAAIEYRTRPAIENTIAYKCDYCIDRQKEGREPACVEACVTGALVFADYNELVNERQKGIALNLTRELQGYVKEDIPDNIRAYRTIQQKLAKLGPLPSRPEK